MDKISPIKERILQFIEYKGITKTDFCNNTNMSYANLKGKSLESELGGTQLYEILSYYREISPDWLILGEGEMLRSQEKKTKIEPQPCLLCAEKERLIMALNSTISTQDNLIHLLQTQSKGK